MIAFKIYYIYFFHRLPKTLVELISLVMCASVWVSVGVDVPIFERNESNTESVHGVESMRLHQIYFICSLYTKHSFVITLP